MRQIFLIFATALLGLAPSAHSQEPPKSELRLLYIGRLETPRAKAFEELLRPRFASVTMAERKSYDPAKVEGVDVALLDWSQGDQDLTGMDKLASPLGAREEWRLPTVLLGSAGLLIAAPWKTRGSWG